MASFTRLSPSRIVTICRGRRTRCAIAVAATASGGETIAPRTRATGHGTPGTSAWTAAATAVVVAMTRPTARSVIERRFVAEVPPRREVPGRVKDRRQEEQEDELRVERHGRQAGDEREAHPADDEEDRIRHLRLVREERERAS